jgi:hypothetical protein
MEEEAFERMLPGEMTRLGYEERMEEEAFGKMLPFKS